MLFAFLHRCARYGQRIDDLAKATIHRFTRLSAHVEGDGSLPNSFDEKKEMDAVSGADSADSVGMADIGCYLT